MDINSIVRIRSINNGRLYGVVESIGDYWIKLYNDNALYTHNALIVIKPITSYNVEQKTTLLKELYKEKGFKVAIYKDNKTIIKDTVSMVDINNIYYIETNKQQLIV